MLGYSIKLTKDDNGTYLVTCPALPEVTTFGESVEDACGRAWGAVEEAVAARMADRERIPEPSPAGRGKYRVKLASQTAAKIALYRAMLDKGISKRQLARSLKWHRPQVDRLLNIRHPSSWGAMDAAFAAMGAEMRVEIDW
jgi:antitoxin HicB